MLFVANILILDLNILPLWSGLAQMMRVLPTLYCILAATAALLVAVSQARQSPILLSEWYFNNCYGTLVWGCGKKCCVNVLFYYTVFLFV